MSEEEQRRYAYRVIASLVRQGRMDLVRQIARIGWPSHQKPLDESSEQIAALEKEAFRVWAGVK